MSPRIDPEEVALAILRNANKFESDHGEWPQVCLLPTQEFEAFQKLPETFIDEDLARIDVRHEVFMPNGYCWVGRLPNISIFKPLTEFLK